MVRLAVSKRIEIAWRLRHRNGTGRAHAARQSERSEQTEYSGAHASHRKIHRQVLIPIKDFHG
jgi:hypothetical protein